MCPAPRSPLYPFSLRPSSLINNCFNPPLILQTIAQFVFVCVCCTLRVPHTIHQISRATLRQASPTATKGNCFLIKPPALIPMIFSRHELAHTHALTHTQTLKRGQRLKEGHVQQDLHGCKLDKCVIGFVSISLLSTVGSKAGGEHEVTHVLKQ